MKYSEFNKLQRELMNKAENCIKKSLFMEWEKTMEELTKLQQNYIDKRMAGLIKGGSSRSDKKAAAARENGKKGGRPKKS